MKYFKKPWFVLLLITFFAFGQRFFNVASNPPSLNWDEISHGYNAFSLLKTGADEWGMKFPLIFRAFGDYKLPLYIYLTAIPVYFLGLTATSVRLVSVLAGTLAIPGIYLLTRKLFPNKKSLPFLSAFLLAINPWHFFISRPALEANLALTLVIFGFWALLKALKNPKFYLLSSLLLGLSLHTYNVSRVFVPLMLIVFFVIYRPKFKLERFRIISISIFTLFLSIVGYQVLSGTGTARYSKISILSDAAVYQLGLARADSSLPPLISKLRYNRPLYFLTEFTKYYVSYFSPSFIYQSQGAQYQFAIPGKNLFTLPVTILSLIGGAYLILRRRSKSMFFLFSWLLISPVGAALTADPPQAIRPNLMIPAVIIFASLGLYWVVTLFKKHRWAKVVVLISLLLSCLLGYIRYLDSYYQEYPVKYSWSWQYGYQQVIDYVNENQAGYDRVIFTKYYGEPHLFYAFFTKLNPRDLQSGGDNIRFKQTNWFWTDKIGDTYFVNDWEIPKMLEDTLPLESGGQVEVENSLLVFSPQSLPENVKILKTINFKDGSPAFYIVVLDKVWKKLII